MFNSNKIMFDSSELFKIFKFIQNIIDTSGHIRCINILLSDQIYFTLKYISRKEL
jgi:hypothetical protein